MSRFTYSNDELDMNKILKMNLDDSQSMLVDESISQSRRNADSSIEASLALLRSLGKHEDIAKLSADVGAKEKDRQSEHRPVLESWEEIVAQANLHEPSEVVLEDIVSEAEIQSAFSELDSIEDLFSKKTSIVNKTDLMFLTIATALQVTKSLVFPYVAEKFDYGKGFDPSERLTHNDKSIEAAHREANDKFRDERLKKHGTGHWINILYQTVPYDITKGSKELGINMGGKYHRMYTLGHDPILGWIFGTANILTDCITFNNLHTNRISRTDPVTGAKKMVITPEIVPLGKMFDECYHEVRADPLNLPAAIFAQAQHLKSDQYTKIGLPIPILSSLNEQFASKLYRENYDALCLARDAKIVGASFLVSKLFDMIISLLHGLFRKKDEDQDLYEVRSRKILLISNVIASSSTIINASITSNPRNLDIGSLLNTVTHLFSDVRFILKIKQEFIESEIADKVQKELLAVNDLFEEV